VLNHMRELTDAPIFTSVIVQGELMFMAHRSERKGENLARVQLFLRGMTIYSVDYITANIYGNLKADILEYYGPKEKKERRKTRIEALGISDNDLWIAAIALQHSLIIVSADSDFQRISAVRELQLESWESSP